MGPADPDVASAAAGVGTACVGPVGPDAASAAAGVGTACVVPADPDAASAAADVGTAWVAIAAAVGGAELGGAAGAASCNTLVAGEACWMLSSSVLFLLNVFQKALIPSGVMGFI